MLRQLYWLFLLCMVYPAKAQLRSDTAALGKYSYLVYGKTRLGCIVQATGFFIRLRTDLYFVTACHVINGWKYESYDKVDVYPDTLYVRISHATSPATFIPLDIRKPKRSRPREGWPDIYFYRLRLPVKYRVNSVEGMIVHSPVDVQRKPLELIVFGYHLTVDADTIDFEKMPLSKTRITRKDSAMYTGDPYSFHYFYPGAALGPGSSGSPLFRIYGGRDGRRKVVFGGMVTGGVPAAHEVLILDADVIRKLINVSLR